jgi:hypothetical protein
MNTMLDTRASLPDVGPWRAAPARRLTVADRLALRIGLALVLWARRPVAPDREVLRHRAELARAAATRRDDAERTIRLLLPVR